MYTFIYPLFISDECYYHSNDTTFMIELLFDFPASNGYHPVPSRVGYIFAGIVGFVVGKQVVRYLDKKVNNEVTLN